MGRLFAGLFERAGHAVRCLDLDNADQAETLVQGVGLVLVAVPIALTVEAIAALPRLPPGCILADLTSVKRAPLAAMLAAHPGPVLGLHPMFGPDVASLARQVVVVCAGRDPAACRWLLDLLESCGARLCEETPERHDAAMQLIQAMRHFSAIAYGIFLQREQADLEQLLRLSSPIYRLELGMVGRLFAQDPALYADILLQAQDLPTLVRSHRDALDELLALVEGGRREAIIERFLAARAHFGELAPKLLAESRELLRRMQENGPDGASG